MPSENIYAQFAPAPRSFTDYANELDQRELGGLRLEGQRRQNMLTDLLAQQQRQGMADQQRSQNLIKQVYAGLSPDAAPDARFAALRRTGDKAAIDLADAQEKAWIERRKGEAEAGSKDVDTENKVIATYRDLVGNAASPEQAAQYVQIMHSDPRLKNTAIARVPLDQALAQIGNDPQTFNQWKQQFALGAAKFVEMNKPTYQQSNLGGSMQITALPGLGGAPSVVSNMPITQSADNKATNDTSRANNRAQVGATIRGQNISDKRERDLAAGKVTYQTDGNGNLIALPERAAPGTMIRGQSVVGANGMQPVPGKRPESTTKELASIDAQLSVLDGAIRDVKASPDAFTFKRGMATMVGPLTESAVGRLDSPSERDARSYVFNVVSKVINERAGAAQSAQELARLRSFLPAETDNAQQITDKLESFKGYLADLGNGYAPGKYQPQQPKAAATGAPAKINSDADYNALPSGATFIGPDGKTRRKP